MAEIWTPLKLIAWTQDFFSRKGVDAPRLTAELLLAHALGCDRVRLYLDFEKPMKDPELATFRELVRRRADGEPTAYVVGKREFFGRSFAVSPAVLVPRPETEHLVEAALAALPPEQREVFLLREHAGLRFAEIAEVTGTPENTVKSRMRYALEALRARLEAMGVGAEDGARSALP